LSGNSNVTHRLSAQQSHRRFEAPLSHHQNVPNAVPMPRQAEREIAMSL